MKHRISTLLSVLRFHLASSVRVVVGLGALQVVVVVLVIAIQPEPDLFIRGIAVSLATGEGLMTARSLLGLWAVAAATSAATRITPALRGWHLHLPVRRTEQRQALLLALICTQIPVSLTWLFFWFAALFQGSAASYLHLLSVLWVFAAAATVASRWEHRSVTLLGWGALILSLIGGVAGLGGATLLLAAAELVGSDLVTRVKVPFSRSFSKRPMPTSIAPLVLAWRSLEWRVAVTFPAAGLILGLTWLFLHNNELDSLRAGLASRSGGALALAVLLLHCASLLAVRRPQWPWGRSLPWSARQRILWDALFLALLGIPILGAAAWLLPASAPPLAAYLAFASLRLSGLLRRLPGGLTSLGAATLFEVLLVALLIGLTSLTALLLIVALPAVLADASRRERSAKVSLFRERRYSVTGSHPA